MCIAERSGLSTAVVGDNHGMTIPSPPLCFLGAASGSSELLLVFLVTLLLFGPKELPKVARKLGKLLEELRTVSQEFRDQVMRLDEEPNGPSQPGNPDPGTGTSQESARLEARYGETGAVDGMNTGDGNSTGVATKPGADAGKRVNRGDEGHV